MVLRHLSMASAKPFLMGVAVLVAAACSTAEPGTGFGTAGFASDAALLACADVIAWGTVAASQAVVDGLEVTVDVEEWVYPSTGGDSDTFVADDPAEEVGAPAWEVSGARLLVVVSRHAPASPMSADEGARALRDWRDANSRRTPRDHCARA